MDILPTRGLKAPLTPRLKHDEDDEDKEAEEAEEPDFRRGSLRVYGHQADSERTDQERGWERKWQSARPQPRPQREDRECRDQARPHNADESPLPFRKYPPPIRKRLHASILHDEDD